LLYVAKFQALYEINAGKAWKELGRHHLPKTIGKVLDEAQQTAGIEV